MKKESVLEGILKYSVSTWTNLVVGFLSVVITTRLLTPETYGLISLFYSISNVMMYILTLGMDGALIRFYNEPPGNDTKEQLIYKNIGLGTIICLLWGVIGTLLFGCQISNYVFGICSRILTGMLFFIHILSYGIEIFKYFIPYVIQGKEIYNTKYSYKLSFSSSCDNCCFFYNRFYSYSNDSYRRDSYCFIYLFIFSA